MLLNLVWWPFVLGARLHPRIALHHLFGHSLHFPLLSPLFPGYQLFLFTGLHPFVGGTSFSQLVRKGHAVGEAFKSEMSLIYPDV